MEKATVPRDFLKFDHCLMNLPMDAVEFLDCFKGAFNRVDDNIWKKSDGRYDLPMIHVYGFTNEESRDLALNYFVQRIGEAMDFPAFKASDVVCFHPIRDVSPTSHMYSTSFKLPPQVAFAGSPILETLNLCDEEESKEEVKEEESKKSTE